MKSSLPRARMGIAAMTSTLVIATAGAAYLLSPRSATAQAPTATASATSTASATATATATASASAAPESPPEIRGADVPRERSEPPKADEWKTARKVKVLPDACPALLLREYLRLSCLDRVAVAVVAGDAKDARVAIEGNRGWDEVKREIQYPTAHLTVPLRRGESSISTFRSLTWVGGYSMTYATDLNLVVSWREGDEDPVVLLTSTEVPTPEVFH